MGSAPSWGGAKGPLTPPRHQISDWVLQQKELDSSCPSVVPLTALATEHFPCAGWRHLLFFLGQEDDEEKG